MGNSKTKLENSKTKPPNAEMSSNPRLDAQSNLYPQIRGWNIVDSNVDESVRRNAVTNGMCKYFSRK